MELGYRNKRNKLGICCKSMAPNRALKISFGLPVLRDASRLLVGRAAHSDAPLSQDLS